MCVLIRYPISVLRNNVSTVGLKEKRIEIARRINGYYVHQSLREQKKLNALTVLSTLLSISFVGVHRC